CIIAMAVRVAKSPRRFRLLLTSEFAFPSPLAEQHLAARRQTFHILSGLVKEAITDGTCRPIDPDLAALTLAGVANWIAFWFPRHNAAELTPTGVAEYLADIALSGLLNPRAREGQTGIPQALTLLREDVQRLEQLLNTSK